MNLRKHCLSQRITTLQKTLFYLWIALLPSQLGIHYWPNSSLVVGLRIDYISLVLYLTDLIALSVLLLEVICFFTERKRVNWEQWRFSHPLLFLFTWQILQLLWVPLTLPHFVYVLKLVLYVLFFVTVNTLDWKKSVVARLFTIQLVIICLLTVWQGIVQHSIGGLWYWFGERTFSPTTPNIALEDIGGNLWLRPYATFSHPNVLAGYVLGVVVWMWSTVNKKELLYKTISSGVGFITIALSFSHAAWVTLGLVSFLLIKKLKMTNTQIISTTFFCLITPGVFFLFSAFIENESVVVRNLLFSKFCSFLPSGLLFGTGWWGTLLGGIQPMGLNAQTWFQPLHHSWWLVTISVGLVPLSYLYYWLNKKKNKYIFKITNVYVLGAVALLGSVDHYWITQQQTLLLLYFLVFDSITISKHQ